LLFSRKQTRKSEGGQGINPAEKKNLLFPRIDSSGSSGGLPVGKPAGKKRRRGLNHAGKSARGAAGKERIEGMNSDYNKKRKPAGSGL
jgi:hypothetical protein